MQLANIGLSHCKLQCFQSKPRVFLGGTVCTSTGAVLIQYCTVLMQSNFKCQYIRASLLRVQHQVMRKSEARGLQQEYDSCSSTSVVSDSVMTCYGRSPLLEHARSCARRCSSSLSTFPTLASRAHAQCTRTLSYSYDDTLSLPQAPGSSRGSGLPQASNALSALGLRTRTVLVLVLVQYSCEYCKIDLPPTPASRLQPEAQTRVLPRPPVGRQSTRTPVQNTNAPHNLSPCSHLRRIHRSGRPFASHRRMSAIATEESKGMTLTAGSASGGAGGVTTLGNDTRRLCTGKTNPRSIPEVRFIEEFKTYLKTVLGQSKVR